MVDIQSLIRASSVFALAGILSACASSGPVFIPSGPPNAGGAPDPQTSTRQTSPQPARSGALPPAATSRPAPVISNTTRRTPQIMRAPGLENVIGASASQLERRFGQARLRVQEGDALKLQFSGEPCVLDVYLYPLQRGDRPSATHVEARRASDGRPVDRASCVEALRRM